MSLTLGNYAASYYNTYSFKNSSTYTQNKVDSSEISKDTYNVSNLTNALDAVDNGTLNSFASVTNVGIYSQNVFKVSQLSEYNDVKDKISDNDGLINLLSGSTDLSSMYNLLGSQSKINAENTKKIIQQAEEKPDTTDTDSNETNVNSYSGYLNRSSSGSLLDVLA